MDAPCEPLVGTEALLDICEGFSEQDTDPARAEQAAQVASKVAWALAGRRHGICEVAAERPGRVRASGRIRQWGGTPAGYDPCDARSCCGCNRVDELILGRQPVVQVDEVRIAGVAVDESEWRLTDEGRILRVGGAGWPRCQRLTRPDDADDVVVVDYQWGLPVDTHATVAIARFGCEVLKMLHGQDCALSDGITQLNRQGISIDVLDPFDFLADGRTGVIEFDIWLRTVNPHRRHSRPRVRTPDVARPVTFPTPPAPEA